MTTLGERIKMARGAFSQDAFSSQIDVNKGSLGFYERDENIPKADVLLRIAEKTGVSVEWLMTGNGHMRKNATPCNNMPQTETTPCPHCARLAAELDEERRERRALSADMREVNAENRRLARENGDLRVKVAVLHSRIEALSGNVNAADTVS